MILKAIAVALIEAMKNAKDDKGPVHKPKHRPGKHGEK